MIIDDFTDDIDDYFPQEKILKINAEKGLTVKNSEIITDRLKARKSHES